MHTEDPGSPSFRPQPINPRPGLGSHQKMKGGRPCRGRAAGAGVPLRSLPAERWSKGICRALALLSRRVVDIAPPAMPGGHVCRRSSLAGAYLRAAPHRKQQALAGRHVELGSWMFAYYCGCSTEPMCVTRQREGCSSLWC